MSRKIPTLERVTYRYTSPQDMPKTCWRLETAQRCPTDVPTLPEYIRSVKMGDYCVFKPYLGEYSVRVGLASWWLDIREPLGISRKVAYNPDLVAVKSWLKFLWMLGLTGRCRYRCIVALPFYCFDVKSILIVWASTWKALRPIKYTYILFKNVLTCCPIMRYT